MAEQSIPEFSRAALEHDIDRLSGEVARHREMPESKYLTGPEILKQSLRSLTIVPAGTTGNVSPVSLLPPYADDAPPEVKLEVEKLLEVALTKGVLKASEELRKADPFVIDAFHDALVGKLYPEFQRRKILE